MFQFLMWGDRKITALQEMHAFEVAAEVIYRRQFWRGEGNFKESLVHAAENEKKHKDNLLKRLEELGAKPHFLRYPLYLVGSLMASFHPSSEDGRCAWATSPSKTRPYMIIEIL